MYGHLVMFGCVWSCMDLLYGLVCYIVLCCHLLSSLALYDVVWSFMVYYRHVRYHKYLRSIKYNEGKALHLLQITNPLCSNNISREIAQQVG